MWCSTIKTVPKQRGKKGNLLVIAPNHSTVAPHNVMVSFMIEGF